MFFKRTLYWVFLLNLALIFWGCPDPEGDDDSSSSPTPDVSPTAPPQVTPTPAVIPTPTLQPTPTPTTGPTPTPALVPTPTVGPTPTPGVVPTPTSQPTPTPGAGPTPTPEVVPTPTPLAGPTPTPRIVATPTPEAGPTPTPGIVPTPTPEVGPTPTPEATPTPPVTPTAAPTPLLDADGDGFVGADAGGDDCDDQDPDVHPGAFEVCDDAARDEDCDGLADDNDPDVQVQVPEGLSGFDQTLYYADADGDGFGSSDDSGTYYCIDPSTASGAYVVDNTDCDDADAAINPAAAEVCDDIDNNCDGQPDEGLKTITYYSDADGDGYGNQDVSTEDCAAPDAYVDSAGDCDDGDAAINPDAAESCNGIDDNCDGDVDEGVKSTFYLDADGDGYGDSGNMAEACSAPDGYVMDQDDCDDENPASYPNADEVCDDGIDQDCNGSDLSCNDVDNDEDGFTENEGDCDDSDPAVNPLALEICNGYDDDCDDEIDEDVTGTYYPDADADGFGDEVSAVQDCEAPEGYIALGGDCNDDDPTIHPDAEEICGDEVDENCDGVLGTYTSYAFPVSIQENTGTEQVGLPVRIIIDDPEITAPLAAAPSSLRVFAQPTDDPYADPYAGVPFHRETITGTQAIIWVLGDLPGGAASTYSFYFGDPDAPDVDDPYAIFEYFEDFTDGVDDWVQTSDYSGSVTLEASHSYFHSAPYGMRNYMVPPGSCQGAHWAYAEHPFEVSEAGLFTFAFYTRSASCSGCTMYSRVFVDGTQIHNVYDPGPDLHYNAYQMNFEAGEHDLSAGIYTTQMCSGTFQASHDDFMLARTVDPPPEVTLLSDQVSSACR